MLLVFVELEYEKCCLVHHLHNAFVAHVTIGNKLMVHMETCLVLRSGHGDNGNLVEVGPSALDKGVNYVYFLLG